jgi:hypothetical protein
VFLIKTSLLLFSFMEVALITGAGHCNQGGLRFTGIQFLLLISLVTAFLQASR